MTADMEHLERDVERQFAELGRLLDATPSAGAVERVKSAVDSELARLHRRDRLASVLRPWVGAAAAVLLAVGLATPRAAHPTDSLLALSDNPEQAFSGWVKALDESGEQFAALLDDDWILDAYGAFGDDDGADIDPLDSLEESFESLERMIGT